MSRRLRAAGSLAAACIFLILFGFAAKGLSHTPRRVAGPELLVTLPVVAQVVLAGGDRYLAANMATFRALVTSTEVMTADDFALQGKIQADAAWLNPAQEDNYYIAAAILPWNGQLEASQYILSRAAAARPFDWQPPFYYAFNAYYFLKDPVEGARWLRKASEATADEEMILGFQQIAALWVAKGPDLEVAIGLHRELAKKTRHKEFAAFLEKRAVRLENLLKIEKSVASYQQSKGFLPTTIEELVGAGVLSAVPIDPFGMAYMLDQHGRPKAQQRAVNAGTGGGR